MQEGKGKPFQRDVLTRVSISAKEVVCKLGFFHFIACILSVAETAWYLWLAIKFLLHEE